eukprot:CAMPEP_0198736926 /NCGR_PEP_ID=MMETSP1475-20131203/67605_1 /TAXON_ID= ORGANISM="Unidentified sp., Strain CCMP1999" /NCGR_SAMPLE_ID=MMETSP1475 /ASSEMBLY_ACC=CAM_ASM_001111 /LENGTH=239 /DNA_ID=CAMNT_0044500779 /DNA_START=44 /DNA_END=763 /DNA_ORIENTATION=-
MPAVIGLSGAIASGKSSASRVLSSCGVPIVDADEIAKRVVDKGTLGLFLVWLAFGKEVLTADGALDREKMGQMVFSDPKFRKRLNMCTHPLIILEMIRQLVVNVFIKFEPVTVLDTPLLFETKILVRFCTATVVVACSEENQLTRLMRRNELTEQQARQRISSQMPLETKKKLASVVIDNDGSVEDLEGSVKDIIERLRPSRSKERIFRGFMAGVYGSLCVLSLRRLQALLSSRRVGFK